MTAPKLHKDEFTNRQNAPPMTSIDRGYQLKVTYHPDPDEPTKTRVVRGTVSYAGYGRFRDLIEFTPHHTDNTWRLEINDSNIRLAYAHGDDWVKHDAQHLETTAQIEVSRT